MSDLEGISIFSLADEYGVSIQTIKRKCESGEIKAYQVQNQWMVDISELDNPILKQWKKEKESRYRDIKESQEILSDSKSFIDGLRKEELRRKQDSVD